MNKTRIVFVALFFVCITVVGGVFSNFSKKTQISGAPPDGIDEKDVPALDPWQEMLQNWQRPEGPPKVALQVGHWKNQDVPEELDNLKRNTGASSAGHDEVDVNLDVAERTADLLIAKGIEVEILPATVPPDYWADAFVAIHADGNTDPTVSGFKIASPWRDLSGDSGELVAILEKIYGERTQLAIDPNITRNMRGYYAFAWWRYDHSIHPMTTAAIVETGFITSPKDRKIIVNQSHIVAQALADGIEEFLEDQGVHQSS